MQTIFVLQNTDFENLGLIEDHLEGRNIRFRYIRPAHDQNWFENISQPCNGLIILGAAPYGTVSPPLLPQLKQRVTAVENCLQQKIPVVAFGTGTQILAMAAGYEVQTTNLDFRVEVAFRTTPDALGGYLPDQYPVVTMMRDMPNFGTDIKMLSQFQNDTPAAFQFSDTCLGFVGHPGIKSAMIEDAVVQSNFSVPKSGEMLAKMREMQSSMENALVSIMVGIINFTGWMQ